MVKQSYTDILLSNCDKTLQYIDPNYGMFKPYLTSWKKGCIIAKYMKNIDDHYTFVKRVLPLELEIHERGIENEKSQDLEYLQYVMGYLYEHQNKRLFVKNGLFDKRIVKLVKIRKNCIETMRYDLPDDNVSNEVVKLTYRKITNMYIEKGYKRFQNNCLYWKPPTKVTMRKYWKVYIKGIIMKNISEKKSFLYTMTSHPYFDKNVLNIIVHYL
jgi:hypothetical protein